MAAHILRRLLQAFPTLLVATLVIFILLHLAPGDPIQAKLQDKITPQAYRAMRAKYGLDRPLPVQFLMFLKHAFIDMDFGPSTYKPGFTVSQILVGRLAATVELALPAVLLAAMVGVPAGVIAAVRRKSIVDYAATSAATVGVSIPIFFLGFIFILLFPSLPSVGRCAPELYLPAGQARTHLLLLDAALAGRGDILASALSHLLLPVVTLATVPTALIARVTRSAMLDAFSADYVRTALAKGVSRWRLVLRHALRNAMIPVMTIVSLQLGYLLAGAVLTETVFSWPGLGTYIKDAALNRDYHDVLGAAVVVVTIFVGINLLVDVLYVFADPRVRPSEKGT